MIAVRSFGEEIDGRIWRRAGPNVTADQTRISLFTYSIRPFERPQWKRCATLRPEVLAGANEQSREMLGYGSNPTRGLEGLYLGRGAPAPEAAVLRP